MGCGIDWPMVLAFTKATAAPVATIASALIISAFAVRTYRKQKALERRIGWYEATHRILDQVKTHYWMWNPTPDEFQKGEGQPIDPNLGQLVAELQSQVETSWLYASRRGFEAIQRANVRLEKLHGHGKGVDRKTIEAVVRIIDEASIALANEMRRELGMEDLSQSLLAFRDLLPPTA